MDNLMMAHLQGRNMQLYLKYRSYLIYCCVYGLYVYRVSQEERAKLREGVPYVKLYRYNPRHLCPKLNGYGDKGARKVWSSCGSTICTLFAWRNTHTLPIVCSCLQPTQRVPRCDCKCKVLGNPKDNYDVSASVFVVQFNGFMSLTSYFDVKYRY